MLRIYSAGALASALDGTVRVGCDAFHGRVAVMLISEQNEVQ